MNAKYRICIFDFDGVLIDSYTCLPSVYNFIAYHFFKLRGYVKDKFIQRALAYEDEQDVLENYNRRKWWLELFREFEILITEAKLNKILKIFWKKRVQQSIVFENSKKTLASLRMKGLDLIIMSGNDGIPSMKRNRIKKSGLFNYFNDILIVGEDIRDRLEGLKLIMRKYMVSPEKVIFIDDKPSPINEINHGIKGITTVKVEFDGPLKLAWRGECKPNYRIRKIDEIETIIN